MKTKIIVSVLVSGVCLFFGSTVFASDYLGAWKGKTTVFNTTCPSVYQNGASK